MCVVLLPNYCSILKLCVTIDLRGLHFIWRLSVSLQNQTYIEDLYLNITVLRSAHMLEILIMVFFGFFMIFVENNFLTHLRENIEAVLFGHKILGYQ